MENKRTLSYTKAQKLTAIDLQEISAASGCVLSTLIATYESPHSSDTSYDCIND